MILITDIFKYVINLNVLDILWSQCKFNLLHAYISKYMP